MKPHKHAARAAEYAKDLAINEHAYRGWRQRTPGQEWNPLGDHPRWIDEKEYERIPATINININGFEVPEPMREAPEIGGSYYIASLCSPDNPGFFTWTNDTTDRRWLTLGLIHLTREAAILHGKALLSFTAQPESK